MQLRTIILVITAVTLVSTAGLTFLTISAFYTGHESGRMEQKGRQEGVQQGIQLGAKAQQGCEAAKASDANPQQVTVSGAGDFACANLGKSSGRVWVHPPEFKAYDP